MALVERQRDAELAVIARDDRRPLAEARIDHCLHARLALDVGELRSHVAVARPVGFLVRDGDAGLGRHGHALVAHRFAESIRPRDQRDGREVALLQVGKDFLARHLVRVRRLEHPLAHGLDDLDGAGKRDKRDLRFLEQGHHGKRRACCGASDHGDDLVLLDQAGGKGARRVGVGAVVVHDQLQLLAVHAALGIDLVDVELERPLLRVAQKRGRTRNRQHRSDLDLRGRCSGCKHAGEKKPDGSRHLCR